jgi:predicted amidophosphoribosyltransferase
MRGVAPQRRARSPRRWRFPPAWPSLASAIGLLRPAAARLGEFAGRTLAAVEQDWLGGRDALPGAASWRPDEAHRWCHRCGGSVGPGERRSPCGACPPRAAAEAIIRLGAYESPLREWVLSAKYAADDLAAERLGRLLARQIEACREVDRIRTVVAAVPMPPLRRWQRRIDHAGVIADAVASVLDLPRVHPLRQRGGPPRSGQDRAERRRSRIRPRVPAGGGGRSMLEGLAVILVDDVLTTGATVRESSRWLRWMGAERVVAAVAAVTPAAGQRAPLAIAENRIGDGGEGRAGDDLGKVFNRA